MARIDMEDFDRLERDRITLQEAVPGAYLIAEPKGTEILQIETYGRNGIHRKMDNHPTQVLQIDKPTFEKILEIVKENHLFQ